MALKGSEILKRLPNKKGCKECGLPTCFAFAMKLVSGATTVDKCPYLSAEAKNEIEESLAPPIRLITVGSGNKALCIGNEDVLFRHENRFVHQPGLGILISDKEDESTIEDKKKKAKEPTCDWLGLTLGADLIALHHESGNKSNFEALVKRVYETTELGIVLLSEDLDALFSARDICVERNPLLYPITRENIDEAIPQIKAKPTPVAVRGGTIEEITALTSKLKDAGVVDLVLAPSSKNILEAIRDQTFIRRAALKRNFRPLGYPTMVFPCFIAEHGLQEILVASLFVIKYAGIIVLSNLDQRSLPPLLVQRLNIYTNPQLPLTVKEKIYEIGKPSEESPVFITSNWALTCLLLSSAVEATDIPAFICTTSTGEADVLCWCHHCLRSIQLGSLNSDNIRQFINECGIQNRVKHRKLIIPGRASRFKAELENALPDWEIIIGPVEAAKITGFLQRFAGSLTKLP
jgi:acetyl-CoA decarbonylase/synthase complex subunit gamma